MLDTHPELNLECTNPRQWVQIGRGIPASLGLTEQKLGQMASPRCVKKQMRHTFRIEDIALWWGPDNFRAHRALFRG